jgi:hypothetical protein
MTASGNPEPARLRAGAVEWRLIDGEIVAIDLQKAEYVLINASGATLWPSLVEGATREELVQQLVDRYDLAAGDAAADVDAFLDSLASRSLLE